MPNPTAARPPARREPLAFAVGFLLTCLATGELEARGGEPPLLFAGTVRDTAHEPVAGATVWLTTHAERTPEQTEIVAETRTDEAGRFSFSELPPDDSDRSAPTFVVRDSQGRIGWDGPVSIYDRTRAISLRIEFREFVEVRGRVIDDDGKGVASALIRPSAFGVESEFRLIGLPDQMSEELVATTAADGGFILPRVPTGAYLRCDVAADGFGRPSVRFKVDQPPTIQLSRAGSIAGRLAPPAGFEPVMAGFKLRVALRGDTGVRWNYAEDVVVHGDGTFQSGPLPPGWYLVTPAMAQPFPFFAEPLSPLEVKPSAAIEGVSVPLRAGVELHGRVVARASGEGIENVELTAACVFPTTEGQVADGYQHVTTGANGRFTVLLAPAKANVHVTRAPPEFLVPAHHFGATALREFAGGDEWPTIELEPAARVDALVIDENGDALEGAEMRYDSTVRERPRVWGPIFSDAGGRFSVLQVDPKAPFSIRARTATAASGVAKQFTPAELDGPVKLTVSPGHAFRLRGKLVDNAGKPVPSAEVSIMWRHEVVVEDRQQIGNLGRGRPGVFRTIANSALDQLTSDADGSFETAALWPSDSYQVVTAAAGFAPLETAIVRGAEGKTLDLGELVLKRNDEVVSGLVVDEEGRPVAGADIHFASPWGPFHEPVSSDADGRFKVQPVDSSAPLLLRARTATAASDGAWAVLPEELSQPVELVVAPRHAFRWQGRVLDRQGKPVAGAKVSVVWERRVASQRSRETLSRRTTTPSAPVTLDRVATAADGTFETQPLWPGEKYRLVATADGYDSVESAVDRGSAGQTRVVEPLVLRRSDLAIEGRVVDSAGHPLEGARVVNVGDAPNRVQSTTDAAGRFRLDGLYEGKAYVLARKRGYRAAGWRGAAGAGPVEIRLITDELPLARAVKASGGRKPPGDTPITDDGPIPRATEASRPRGTREVGRQVPRRKPPGETLFAEQREFARKQLTELWKLRDRFDEKQTPVTRFGVLLDNELRRDAAFRLAVCMARLDISRALKWSAAEGGRFDEAVQVAAAESVAHYDLEGAILQLADIKTPSAGDALARMARRKLAAGAGDEAIRLLEAARSCPRPNGLADIYALAVAAGQGDWGRPLIEQLAESFEKRANPQPPGLAQAQVAAARGGRQPLVHDGRGYVAVALAMFDAPRAIRLLATMGEPLPNGFPNPPAIYIARAAVAMGANDSKHARELLRRIDNARLAHEVRMKIAYQLAATDLDAALGWIDEIGGNGVKAEALSWIAQVVARRDKPRAYALIDRALDLYQTYGDNDYGGRPVEAAAIAVRAGAIDYPDMPSVIDRVLSARVTATEEPSPARLAESVVNTALVLALVDRAVACELLLAIEPQAALVGTDVGSLGRAHWLQAWALADFDEAKRRYADEFAALASFSAGH